MKKLLLAPNSFKQCADSVKIAEMFKKYLEKGENIESISKPISDGGDGFYEICRKYFDTKRLTYEIPTPYDNSTISCNVALDEKNKTAYIESADVLGLKIIPLEHHKPMFLSSKGFGELLIRLNEDIKNGRLNIEKVIIGIGGTATNDLGLGMCSQFNLELIDIFNKNMEILPESYYRIKKINWSDPGLNFQINIVLDVLNPLLGKMGATRTFGLQKGLVGGEIEVLELGFTKVIHTLEKQGVVKNEKSLFGAGGGLAAGLQIFFNAGTQSAENFILSELKLKEYINKVDFVITGEGYFDSQTLLGKGAGIILKLFKNSVKKVFLCCGEIEKNIRSKLPENVHPIEMIKYSKSKEDSIKNIELGIAQAAAEIQKAINS